MGVIKGTSPSGFEYAIDESGPASWAFLTAAKKLQSGNLLGAVDMVDILFSQEDQDRLVAHLSKDGAPVTTEAVMAEVDAIINDMRNVKKSSPSQTF